MYLEYIDTNNAHQMTTITYIIWITAIWRKAILLQKNIIVSESNKYAFLQAVMIELLLI